MHLYRAMIERSNMHVAHAATPALEGLIAITLGTWGFEFT